MFRRANARTMLIFMLRTSSIGMCMIMMKPEQTTVYLQDLQPVK
jgi:hypothetical protein